jgi:antitoxin component of RelBE/YafQ-DinJ toxin-antitoxin module
MGKKTVTITIDEELWNKAEIVLNKVGMSRSEFISIVLEGVVETGKKSLRKLFQEVSKQVYEAALKHKAK